MVQKIPSSGTSTVTYYYGTVGSDCTDYGTSSNSTLKVITYQQYGIKSCVLTPVTGSTPNTTPPVNGVTAFASSPLVRYINFSN